LYDLPTELLLRIGQELPTPDLCSFRLACRSAEEAGFDVLKDRLTRLYLHPARLTHVIELFAFSS
jgi:hypothetical protein